MRVKPLVAVALAGAVTLIAAPSASAGWITGRGSLPLMRSDAVCEGSMDFQFATYVDSPQARLLGANPIGVATLAPPSPPTRPTITPPAPVTLHALGVWAELPDGSLDPDPLVVPGDYLVPWRPFAIDLATDPVGGAIAPGGWPGAAGQLTHSATFTLVFARRIVAGTRVRVAWGNWSPGQPSATSWSFEAGSCRSPLGGRPIPH